MLNNGPEVFGTRFSDSVTSPSPAPCAVDACVPPLSGGASDCIAIAGEVVAVAVDRLVASASALSSPPPSASQAASVRVQEASACPAAGHCVLAEESVGPVVFGSYVSDSVVGFVQVFSSPAPPAISLRAIPQPSSALPPVVVPVVSKPWRCP